MRTKILNVVDIILRVPPLFVIDELLKIGLGLPFINDDEIDISETLIEQPIPSYGNANFTTLLSPEATFYSMVIYTLLRFGFCCLGEYPFTFNLNYHFNYYSPTIDFDLNLLLNYYLFLIKHSYMISIYIFSFPLLRPR